MSRQIVMGLERETAFVPYRGFTSSNSASALPRQGMHSSFHVNGGRYYMDCGDHLEMCTPECTSPFELLRQSVGQDNYLRGPWHFGVFVKSNFDPTGNEDSYGTHENYSHDAFFEEREHRKIASFIASRTIICGEGGVDANGHPVISRRLCHIGRPVGRGTQSYEDRGLVDTRDESLGNARRLHIIAGGDNMSDWSTALKFGMTALAVILVEDNQVPFSFDCTDFQSLNKRLEIAGHPWIEQQGEWLDAVKQYYNGSPDRFPEWAPRIIQMWEHVLDGLCRDSASMDAVLDWRARYRIYKSVQNQGRNAINQAMFRYGELSPLGIFEKMRGRFASLPEGQHGEMLPMAADGRAHARAWLIQRLENMDVRFDACWNRVSYYAQNSDCHIQIELPNGSSGHAMVTKNNRSLGSMTKEQALHEVSMLAIQGYKSALTPRQTSAPRQTVQNSTPRSTIQTMSEAMRQLIDAAVQQQPGQLRPTQPRSVSNERRLQVEYARRLWEAAASNDGEFVEILARIIREDG